ncbi:putative DNA mismatch repair protein MutS [Blattamonas nauphoetae]|uniref:DNA mismatch repair protein MutS n=1 Tax=Blattamonas nauphoetae TaxID=2049346 RepID=A0ABQ9XKX1_9EUKA|nr:putative DNA mismatch repair protein MutS [Blattamonas nauphoetae]
MTQPFDANEKITAQVHTQDEIDKLTIDDERPLIDHVKAVFIRGSQFEKETLITSLPYFIRQCGASIYPYLPQALDAIALSDSSFRSQAAVSFAECIFDSLIPPHIVSTLIGPICHLIVDFEDLTSITYLDLLGIALGANPTTVSITDVAEVFIQKTEVFEKAPVKMAACRVMAKFLQFLGIRLSSNTKYADLLVSSTPADSLGQQMDDYLKSLVDSVETNEKIAPSFQPYHYLPSATTLQADPNVSQQRLQGNYVLSYSTPALPLPAFFLNGSTHQLVDEPLSFTSLFPLQTYTDPTPVQPSQSNPLHFRCLSPSHHTAPVFQADFNSLPSLPPDKGTACCCLSRVACVLSKTDRINRVWQTVLRKVFVTQQKEKKIEDEKKEDKTPQKAKGKDSDVDDDISLIFVYLRSLGHFLLLFVGFDDMLHWKDDKNQKDDKSSKDSEQKPDKQLGVQTVNSILSFYKQATTVALHSPHLPSPVPPPFSLLLDCAYVYPSLVRFGSFARHIHLLPLVGQLSSGQTALMQFTPFLQIQFNALMGTESVDARKTLAKSFSWISELASIILEKEDKADKREKDSIRAPKPDNTFLSRHKLWQHIQSLTTKEREKESERVSGYILKSLERFLADSSVAVLAEAVPQLPFIFHSVTFTTEQLSTFTHLFILFLQRISPVIVFSPAASRPPSPPSSPPGHAKVSSPLILSWRQLVSLFHTILILLPLFSAPQIVQSLLPFFLSFVHQPPTTLSFAACYSFCRTLRSVRSKRVRTDVMSCLILALAHSSSARHRISFFYISTACFLCFSRKWCKITVLPPLLELLQDPAKEVVVKTMKLLPVLRASLILPQDLHTLTQLTQLLTKFQKSPNLLIRRTAEHIQADWKAMDSAEGDTTIGLAHSPEIDAVLQEEEEKLQNERLKTQGTIDSDERELSKIDTSGCFQNVIAEFVPTALQSVQVIVSSTAFPQLVPALASSPILASVKPAKSPTPKPQQKPASLVIPPTITIPSTSNPVPLIKPSKQTGILLSDGTVASSMLSSISPPPTVLASIFSALNSPSTPVPSPPMSPSASYIPSPTSQTPKVESELTSGRQTTSVPVSSLSSVPLSSRIPNKSSTLVHSFSFVPPSSRKPTAHPSQPHHSRPHGTTPSLPRSNSLKHTAHVANLIGDPDKSQGSKTARAKLTNAAHSESPVPKAKLSKSPPISVRKQRDSVTARHRDTRHSVTGATKLREKDFVLQPIEVKRKASPKQIPRQKPANTSSTSTKVGIASFTLQSSKIRLLEYSDTQTYSYSVFYMAEEAPTEILIPTNMVGLPLATLLQRLFPCAVVVPLARKFYNDSIGLRNLQQYSFDSSHSLASFSPSHYLAFGASLRVQFDTPANRVLMNTATVEALEIVESNKMNHRPRLKPKSTPTSSLLSFLQHTSTPTGTRLLRANLIQPLTNLDTINSRLDGISELCLAVQRSSLPDDSPDLLTIASSLLSKMPDLDTMISAISTHSKTESIASFQRGLQAMVNLQRTLSLLPQLTKLLSPMKTSLLREIVTNFSSPVFDEIVEQIDTIFSAERLTQIGKGSTSSIHALSLIVRPNVSSVIDLSRTVYEETMNDLRSLLLSYQSTYSTSSLKLHFATKRGVYLSVATEELKKLPESFNQRVKLGNKRMSCSTDEIASLSVRCKKSLNDIIVHSFNLIKQLQSTVRSNIGLFFRLTESISLLDLIVSLATVAHTNPSYVRPELSYNGPIVLKRARHPLREKLLEDDYVPNDVFITPERNIQIVTGSNMSGKTSYLHLVASLTVLAQIGHTYADSDIHGVIYTGKPKKRICAPGIAELIPKKHSSLILVLHAKSTDTPSSISFTPHSLILLDELGASTAEEEGLGIAWAVCETFADSHSSRSVYPADSATLHPLTLSHSLGPVTLFSTHFGDLQRLESFRTNVLNVHMETVRRDQSATATFSRGIQFTYQLEYGAAHTRDLGIEVAELAGFPQTVIQQAKETTKRLHQTQGQRKPSPVSSQMELGEKLLFLTDSTLETDEIRQYLRELKRLYASVLSERDIHRPNTVPKDEAGIPGEESESDDVREVVPTQTVTKKKRPHSSASSDHSPSPKRTPISVLLSTASSPNSQQLSSPQQTKQLILPNHPTFAFNTLNQQLRRPFQQKDKTENIAQSPSQVSPTIEDHRNIYEGDKGVPTQYSSETISSPPITKQSPPISHHPLLSTTYSLFNTVTKSFDSQRAQLPFDREE